MNNWTDDERVNVANGLFVHTLTVGVALTHSLSRQIWFRQQMAV